MTLDSECERQARAWKPPQAIVEHLIGTIGFDSGIGHEAPFGASLF